MMQVDSVFEHQQDNDALKTAVVDEN